MKHLHEAIEAVILAQALMGGLWLSCWLFDQAFEAALRTMTIQKAFCAFLVGWVLRRNARKNGEK